MDNLITTKDLCNLLKVTRQTVANYRKEGMPYKKFGILVRFNKDEVNEWLENKNK